MPIFYNKNYIALPKVLMLYQILLFKKEIITQPMIKLTAFLAIFFIIQDRKNRLWS